MSLAIQQASFFTADFEKQFGWYVDHAGAEVARRFQAALDTSLTRLSSRPDLGRLRHFRHPSLRGLRSHPVERPFDKILIFYRANEQRLYAVRLLHGARDLPRRLVQPPGATVGEPDQT
jgi:toxin ParE1/3/4